MVAMEPPSKAKTLGFSKLGRSPSSLSRSPTVKSCIGSLTCFSDLLEATDKHRERLDRSFLPEVNRTPRRVDTSRYQQQRRVELQLLVPPLLLIIIPLVWWYVKLGSVQSLNWFAENLSLRFWFDCMAVLLFSGTFVLCARLAVPYCSLGSKVQALYVLLTALSHGWGYCSKIWFRRGDPMLADEKGKQKNNGGSAVTWTIGSKSKLEKSRFYGEGVQNYSNADVYEGEFYQGRCSGSGVYYFYMSGKYEGDWVDGKFDGYGVETWARGSRYRGQYLQGMRDGYGIYRFYTGDVYSGEWSKGQSHGNGVQTCEDGSRYVGEFKHGMKHGFGYYHFRNGDTYAGEYFEDKMHGYGVYHFKNGHQYEGAWHEGRKQGLGLYTFRNGETQEGHWHHGALVTPSTLNPAPGSPSAVSHTKVLNVVQEARHAAAKALEVQRVDDRVKKAVALANRAANAARVVSVKAAQRKNKTTAVFLNV
ncbi:hypothetical protein O6H91_05G124200 [Diphasiastrum complanatum]|uniref:Uncharacterized protein n=4 Tax=Diphasiastrum complanatum TaxID=34168 RepID=A0ACC2DSY9_DIPCM|nr:hypothetical protein O6H91_05G124200 [Diphasiastrum complanatum]KAJ7557371.1 hypothetical protein O6H91_05G124200 [Diphasiastrum complanatum]KAJ7557373.1 hypothetical protein O6H91_05G124200 [Diphasiastrum complanatum]KAJ7557374.1 hypothetical protein O6H91_05G124200 [Diphasiastrum complanatum]